MPPPIVSILINNFNYGRYVAAAIDSALSQTYKNVEVIVVDDGSTDNSRALIEGYSKEIIPVFKENGGQASCFNEGFARSSGDIVCFLDSDDVLLPTKVERVVDALAKSSAEWCFHSIRWTDADLNPAPESPSDGYQTGPCDFRSEVLHGRCLFRPPATSGLAFSKALLQQLLPMPEQIRITSDNYIKLAALGLAPGYLLSDALALQRIHGSNFYTAKNDGKQKASIQVLTAICMRDRLPVLRNYSNRMFAAGLVNSWLAGSSLNQTARTLSGYLVGLPLAEKSDTLARFLFRAFRQSILPANAS